MGKLNSWLYTIALLAALTCLVGIGYGAGLQHGSAAGSSQKPVAASGSFDPASKPFSAYPNPSSNACYGVRNHDVSDLCAQWRAALAAERSAAGTSWANIISFVASALSFFTVILLIASNIDERRERHTSQEMALDNMNELRKQTIYSEAQAKAAVSSTTAYLTIEPITPDFEDWISSGGLHPLLFSIANVGATPAYVKSIEADVFCPYLQHNADSYFEHDHDPSSNYPILRLAKRPYGTHTLASGSKSPQMWAGNLPSLHNWHEIPHRRRLAASAGDKDGLFFIKAKVSYSDVLGRERVTENLFTFVHIRAGRTKQTIAIEVGGTEQNVRT